MAEHQQRSPVSFDSATVEAIVSTMHSEVAAATVQLRLRYLQRLDFPKGAKAGRGKRAVYELADILKVALAFEMLDMDVPPLRAAVTIDHNWPVLERCLAPAWIAARLVAEKGGEASEERVDRLRRIIVLEPGALSGDEAGHTVGLLRPSVLADAIKVPGGGFRNCMLIDLLALVSATDAALQAKPLGFRRAEIDAAFERMGEASHKGQAMADWMPPEDQ